MRLKNKSNISFFALIIIAFASFLRLFQLGQIPSSLYIDEVAMLADVKSVLATGSDIHGNAWYQLIYPSYGDYKLPVYIWLATASSFIFGASAFSLRLVSAIVGIGTVIIAGLIAREIAISFAQKRSTRLSKVFPLCTMFVVAVSPWSVLFSRTGFEGHVAQFFFWVSIYFLLLARKKWWLIFISAFFGVFSIYTYYSVRFVWPPVFLSFLVFQLLSLQERGGWLKVSTRTVLKSISALSLVFLCLLPLKNSPYFVASEQFRLSTSSLLDFETYNQVVMSSNTLINQAGSTIVSKLVFHRHIIWLRELALQYARNLSPNFLFFSGDNNLRHGTGEHGLFLLPFAPFFLLGLICLSKNYPKLAICLTSAIIFSLLPASIPASTPHALRSLNALVPFSLVIGFGIAVFAEHLEKQYNRDTLLATSIATTISVIVIVSVVGFLQYYFVLYPDKSKNAWFDCEHSLIQELSLNSRDLPILFISQPERLSLWILAFDEAASGTIYFESNNPFEIKKIGTKIFDASISDFQTGTDQIVVAHASYAKALTNLSTLEIKKIKGFNEHCQYLIARSR